MKHTIEVFVSATLEFIRINLFWDFNFCFIKAVLMLFGKESGGGRGSRIVLI